MVQCKMIGLFSTNHIHFSAIQRILLADWQGGVFQTLIFFRRRVEDTVFPADFEIKPLYSQFESVWSEI